MSLSYGKRKGVGRDEESVSANSDSDSEEEESHKDDDENEESSEDEESTDDEEGDLLDGEKMDLLRTVVPPDEHIRPTFVKALKHGTGHDGNRAFRSRFYTDLPWEGAIPNRFTADADKRRLKNAVSNRVKPWELRAGVALNFDRQSVMGEQVVKCAGIEKRQRLIRDRRKLADNERKKLEDLEEEECGGSRKKKPLEDIIERYEKEANELVWQRGCCTKVAFVLLKERKHGFNCLVDMRWCHNPLVNKQNGTSICFGVTEKRIKRRNRQRFFNLLEDVGPAAKKKALDRRSVASSPTKRCRDTTNEEPARKRQRSDVTFEQEVENSLHQSTSSRHDPRPARPSDGPRACRHEQRIIRGAVRHGQNEVEPRFEEEPDHREEEPMLEQITVEPRLNETFVARIAALEARAIADANKRDRLRKERDAALAQVRETSTELTAVKLDRDDKTAENTRMAGEILRGREERRQLHKTMTKLTAQHQRDQEEVEERESQLAETRIKIIELEKAKAEAEKLQAQRNECRRNSEEMRQQREVALASLRKSVRIRRLQNQAKAASEASAKRDEEHKEAVQDLIASHECELQEQKTSVQTDLDRRRELIESRLAETRTRLIKALEHSVKLRTEVTAVKSDRDQRTTENTRLTDESLRGEEERRQLQNTIAELTAQHQRDKKEAHEAAAASLGEVEKRCQSQESDLHALRKERNAAVNGRRQVSLERDEFRKQLHAANADSARTSECIRRLQEEAQVAKEAHTKRDHEYTKAVEELTTSHERAMRKQKHDLDRRRKEVESQLAETRTRLIESEKAKTDALESSNKFREALDEEIRSARALDADRLARYDCSKQWTDIEKRTFEQKFVRWGKNFRKIQSFLKSKTTHDCVKYYYYFTKGIEKYNKMFRTKKTRHAKPNGSKLGRRGKSTAKDDQTETTAKGVQVSWHKDTNFAIVPKLKSKEKAMDEYGE